MRDFYAPTGPLPLDQADGLRRLFGGAARRLIPLVANPHLPAGAPVLDRLAAVLAGLGRTVLVVDAAAASPRAPELARLDLAAGIEVLAPGVSYLPARGLPMEYVDTRGSAARFIEALAVAAPRADVVLLHGEPVELARLLQRRAARPLVLGSDHPESIKHAYAATKLLLTRTGLATFDLLLVAHSGSPRLAGIVHSLAGCAENFLGALLQHWALIEPDGVVDATEQAALADLLEAQLAVDDDEFHVASPAPLSARRAVPA